MTTKDKISLLPFYRGQKKRKAEAYHLAVSFFPRFLGNPPKMASEKFHQAKTEATNPDDHGR
jgi:hypothetical protein